MVNVDDFLLRMNGKIIRCGCGCNVFRRILIEDDGFITYRCNSCRAKIIGIIRKSDE